MIKKFAMPLLFLIFAYCGNAYAQELSLEKYLFNFDYQARNNMKIDSAALVKGIKEGKIQLIWKVSGRSLYRNPGQKDHLL